jgi:miniconductance mechanosensitive channel
MTTNWLTNLLTQYNFPLAFAQAISIPLIFMSILIVAAVTTIIVKKTIIRVIIRWIQKNEYQWGVPLLSNNFFSRIVWFIPLAVLAIAADSMMQRDTALYLLSKRLLMTGFVVNTVFCISSLLTSILEIDSLIRKTRSTMMQGYVDALRIISFVLGAIFIISIFTGQSPWGILSVLGGLTAVVLLIFKDSILGFVASLQISALDLVRVGDWIEMSQYGADGDVISISIHTVRVQNFDKTITTIPTYAMVSSSFKNWRGMQDSKGRRIKRPLYIDLTSIRFCDEELLSKLAKIEILKEYIEEKEREIAADNTSRAMDSSTYLNGRRQTNIGVFRAYIGAYLKNNSHINQQMTFLIRQLAPTDHGLPLEIYVFSKDQIWANYEAIQADIFDHLIAAAPEFGLRLFQLPSGHDFRGIVPTSTRETTQ